MKRLREGYTTGSCAAAASMASALLQTEGCCPEKVTLETPSGKLLHLPVQRISDRICGVRKDSGDDPDQTDGCLVTAEVAILSEEGEVQFRAGVGVGTITRKGLKLPVGEPAINPIPRQMITQAVRSVIGARGAIVTISIPGGEAIAERTLNQRLGVVGGLSILGTTGIVRPMSKEAVKESLRLEFSVSRAEHGSACALVTGYSGKNYLKQTLQSEDGIVLCSNYLGYLLDCAEELTVTHLLIAGGTGKLVKPAADIMNLHSHTAGGQREIVCTHAALAGASRSQIQALYACTTTSHMQDLLEQFALQTVWRSIADAACENCVRRTHHKIQIGFILLDTQNRVLAQTEQVPEIERMWHTDA